MCLQLKRKLQSITSKLPVIVTLCLVFFIWLLLSSTGVVPAYMLPSPIAVIKAFIEDFSIIMIHARITMMEAILGLLIGIVLGVITAILMDCFAILDKAIYPLLVITQTIPTIALAPIFVMWMGFGMAPKITLVVITTFFPITVGFLEGLKSVDIDSVNLMRSMNANGFHIFVHLKGPSALPYFFSGLKISASYAVVGAVISEWIGGFEGLGVYMTRVKKAYAFDRMFAVIIFIVLMSLLLMQIIKIIRKIVIVGEKND